MVKNNIVIKINDKMADYDDNTAIGITYNAFNPSEIDKIFLTSTNEFSLPITLNNKKIFDFAENTNSNPSMVYDKMSCYIYLGGVKVMQGYCYVSNINDRYNVQFVEGKTVYDKLKELPFVKLHGDEYPVSLVSLLVNEWNDVELPSIVNRYNPTTPTEYFDAILTHCHNNTSDGYPISDYVLPIVKNLFSEKQYHYNNDGGIDAIENNLFSSSTSDEGYGYVLGKYFSGGQLRGDNEGTGYKFECGKNIDCLTRYGQTLLSPWWVSINRIITVLEDYTGYEFKFLWNCIAKQLPSEDAKLCLHIPAMEFSYDFYLKKYLGARADVYTMYFDGKVQVLKGNKGWYGYKFDEGAVSDIYDENIQSELTCLDLLKSIMQEFCLVADVDEMNKTITFHSFDEIKSFTTNELSLITENTKKFFIDNIKQQQAIGYSNVADGTSAGSLIISCENRNIDEGSETNKLLEIERYLFAGTDYHWNDTSQGGRGKGYSKNICTIDNEANTTSFIWGIPQNNTSPSISVGSIIGNIKNICLSITWMFNGETVNMRDYKRESDGNFHKEMVLYSSKDLECFNTQNYINYVGQVTVASLYPSYEYYQNMIVKPVYEEITVKKDLVFLHNWKNLRKVHIKGMTGNWYVQEISKFNPRTDDKMTLKVVKLPYDFEVYHTLNLSVSPENSGTVTGAGNYASGELVRVTATPNDGWYFKKWSDDVLSNIRDVYMDSDKNLTAMFDDIPSIYKKVEYLENIENSYIDTGINTTEYKLVMEYQCRGMFSYAFNLFFGRQTSQGSGNLSDYVGYRDSTHTVASTGAVQYGQRAPIFNENVFLEYSNIINNRYVKFDNTTYTTSTTNPVDASKNVFLFCINYGGVPTAYFSKLAVSFLQMYDKDNNLIRDYKPVVRISDNKPGLYDKVSGQFYTNQGSGTDFIPGPDL